jgi:glycerol-3-phosphate dehydrogenase
MFHPRWREQALAAIAAGPFDLIVVGGGITGSGILLDAAQRGLKTLLVESNDIASGTSSRSSKLIHGGLRYLKQMQFRVTRLSCAERDRMVDLDPHLVDPIRFLYPARRGDKMPGWTVDLGLWMYDRLTSRPEKHARLDAEELATLAPGIDLNGLDRTLAYSDARTDDARLTLAVAATGLAFGGHALTRAEVGDGISDAEGHVVGVRLRDLLSGAEHEARAHVVVNATGHWTDRLRERFGLEGRRVRPSRGSHLIFSRERLPVQTAVGFISPDDGRPLFVVPHPEGILAGTTDLYHDGDLDDPRPSHEEADYILRAVQAQFPDRALTAADVVATFAGLRPILDTHADNPSEATREEAIWEERRLLSVAGGKLTTWRSTAAEAVDAALDLLPDERARLAGPCRTEGTALVGLAPRDLGESLGAAYGIASGIADAMARRLGARAWLACESSSAPAEIRPLTPDTDLSAAEVRAHARFGGVLRLEDLLLRRARVGVWNPALATELASKVAPILASELGWDAKRTGDEIETCGQALSSWTTRGVI